MSRFLTRKKTQETLDGGNGLLSSKKGKKSKKTLEEPKPEVSMELSLPSSDTFRTSLIMPNLSKRFSMLRDQDNPESLMGKAMDDSVLHPKRTSRLGDFGYTPQGNLGDIAEVSSITGSGRPTFYGRHDSADGYGSDDGASMKSGSIMSRPRPGESNVMFGGRSRVYLGNRTVFDEDVTLSPWQRMRAAEKLTGQDGLVDEDMSDDKVNSSYSSSLRRRGTNSSTTSGGGTRVSTAATSIASQGASQGASAVPIPSPGLERQGTKNKRLYEVGLDRSMLEQQNSAMRRLNSRAGGRPVPLSQAKSTSNLNERYNNRFRPSSPSPTAIAHNRAIVHSIVDSDSGTSSPGAGTPTSPFMPVTPSDENSPLSRAIDPNDRGKATAMGAFNKPAQRFDEKEYLERQRQINQERAAEALRQAPPAISPQPKSPESLPQRSKTPTTQAQSARARLDALQDELAGFEIVDQSPPSAPPRSSRAANSRRPSGNSRPGTSSSNTFPSPIQTKNLPPTPVQQAQEDEDDKPTPFSVFQKAASKMRAASTADSEDERPMSPIESGGSDTGVLSPPLTSPHLEEHPAMRAQYLTSPKPDPKEPNNSWTSPVDSEGKSSISTVVKSDATDVDSPTLGPAGGLSGMIRQHLRSQSDQSSLYGPEPDAKSPKGRANQLSDTPATSSYSHSNPWDLEDIDRYADVDSLSSVSPIDTTNRGPGAMRGAKMEPVRARGGSESESETRSKHHRNVSHATQAERAAFEKELAERQKAIQETLRNKVEAESRSSSPTPSVGGAFKALGMLRPKTSRDSLATRQGPSKTTALLGLASPSSASLARTSEDTWNRPFGRSPKPIGSPDDGYRRDFEERLTLGASKSRSSSITSGPRSRSGSLVSGRAQSRPPRPSEADLPPVPDQISTASLPVPDPRPSSPAVGLSGERSPGSRGIAPKSSKTSLQTSMLPPGPARSPGPAQGHRSAIPSGMNAHRGYVGTGRSPGGTPLAPSPLPRKPQSLFGQQPNHSAPQINSFPPEISDFAPDRAPPPVPMQSSSRSKTDLPRKKSIQKSIISEPMFLSSTSVVDTIELPAGASLRNGMMDPPPVPPVNPKRRRFGFGRSNSHGSTSTGSDGRPSTDDDSRDSRKSKAKVMRGGSNAAPRSAYRVDEADESELEQVPAGLKIRGPVKVQNDSTVF
ncbi:uncharacterized protein J3D65DRAFT_556952 [Phyllosticta citribraziliensis]|uniref:Uncharacterized protein n=1 Tax=Phyllosticta citribraziliensis TaxID=989973 RepID=A0ABR1LFV2_9PEZI